MRMILIYIYIYNKNLLEMKCDYYCNYDCSCNGDCNYSFIGEYVLKLYCNSSPSFLGF